MAGIMMKNSRTRRQEYPPEKQPGEDVQFGYHHSASGKHIRITNDGLGAEKMNPGSGDCVTNGVAYGACPLKGMAHFEVKLTSCWTKGRSDVSLRYGVMRCKKGDPIESVSVPTYIHGIMNHCTWSSQQLRNDLVTPSCVSDYGYVDLDDLCEGDCVGLRISQHGVLEFTVNGESQGIAAKDIYTRDTDVYAVVNHFGSCFATVVTKAGEPSFINCTPICNYYLVYTCMTMCNLIIRLRTRHNTHTVTQYENSNLQELCLDKLSSWLKSGEEVDQLPLPMRLRDRLKECFSV